MGLAGPRQHRARAPGEVRLAGFMKRVAEALLTACVVGSSWVAGCGGMVEPTGGDSPDASTGPVVIVQGPQPVGMVARTIVRIEADGTQQVIRGLITREQAKAESAPHSDPAPNPTGITTESISTATCDATTLRLYNEDYDGGPCPAELCFIDNGNSASVSLAGYDYSTYLTIPHGGGACTGSQPWAAHVYEYYPGHRQSGCFSSTSSYSGTGYLNFYEIPDGTVLLHSETTGSKEADTNYVWLNQWCGASLGHVDCRPTTGDVDLLTDIDNCGECDVACSTVHETPTCVSGVCELGTCASGYMNCDGLTSTGCEIETSNDLNNCGSCGHVCATTHDTPSCVVGVCILNCAEGYGNCDGDLSNGCETNLNTDTAHCGACTTTCSTTNGVPACTAGTCTVASCDGTYLDCTGGTNCTTNSATDNNNCGSCGNVCGSGSTCVTGVCTCTDPSATYCSEGCAYLQTDDNNCGTCGTACGAGNICLSASCESCPTSGGYTECGGLCVDTQTDTSNCGSCGNAVPDFGECVDGESCGGPEASCMSTPDCCPEDTCAAGPGGVGRCCPAGNNFWNMDGGVFNCAL
jgi:hypothetical protein